MDFLKKLYKIEKAMAELNAWKDQMMSDVITKEKPNLPPDLSQQWARKQFEAHKLRLAKKYILNDELIPEREKVKLK